ncbi:DUF3068 domain-containing protein [Nocardioides nitrophenolicus]|uniref:DUF3068 domain-containing protein n=1 Tax=Nocardioides nitrophenolicus TaxID=60489 RepID=UPI001957A7AD|nr:DUF3068 domain-containing protein [Nocardioides nitrophenolicus]MBM7515257.1 hypothetical protein [Nocardioides nitrophenolicus]
MRKFVAPALVGFGTFLLVVGVLALSWVPGAVKKTPLDVDTTTMLSGEAAKIDPATGDMTPRAIHAISLTRTDSKASTDDDVVWAQWSCVAFGDSGDCIKPTDPNTVLLPEDQLVTASYNIFATDRVSAEGIAEADLPKAAKEAGATTTKGLVNKFPFDTKKKTYPYWEGTLGRSVDATFERTQQLGGVEVYVFRTEVSKESIEIAENTPGTYSSVKEIYVHPATGSIINQTEKQQRWLEDGTPVLDLSIGFTKAQIASNGKDAKSNGAMLTLMTTVVPLIGLIGGALMVLAGVLLGRKRSRDDAPRREQTKDLAGV